MQNPSLLSYVFQGICLITNYMSAKFYTNWTNHFDFMGENLNIF
jgi:hypothetical protein